MNKKTIIAAIGAGLCSMFARAVAGRNKIDRILAWRTGDTCLKTIL